MRDHVLKLLQKHLGSKSPTFAKRMVIEPKTRHVRRNFEKRKWVVTLLDTRTYSNYNNSNSTNYDYKDDVAIRIT